MPNPTTNPTNEQALAISLLAGMVAHSASFAEQAASTDPDTDELIVPTPDDLLDDFIHYPEYKLPSQQVTAPFAVIYEEPGSFNYRRIADGTLVPNGRLRLLLGISMQSGDPTDMESEKRFFDNWQGNVIREVKDRSLIPGELRCAPIEQTTPPTRSHPAHIASLSAQKPFWLVEYTLTWDPFL